MRHAKSDWPGGVPDRDRPLARRGRRQAPRAAAWIAASLPPLDLAVVSPATRAVQTWELVAPRLGGARPRVRFEERVYASWGSELLAVVRELDDHVHVVALVGHNPSVEELVHEISGEVVEMRTSAIAVLRWEGHWSDAGRAPAELLAHGRPPVGPVPSAPQEAP
jgi:phosphohistidine phosphatase